MGFYCARFSIQSLFKTTPCPLKRQRENHTGVLASDSSHEYTVDRRSIGQGVWQQPPDYPWPEGSNHSSNKSDPKGGMREGHRELCPPDPSVPAAPGSSFGAHFLSASETKSFCSTDLKLGDVCYTGLTSCSWSFVSIWIKFSKLFDFWWWPFFCVILVFLLLRVTRLTSLLVAANKKVRWNKASIRYKRWACRWTIWI